jgi:hypothetical protein
MPRPKVSTEYYLLTVWRDVEPNIQGKFKTPEERDRAARKYRTHHGNEDGVYGLDVVDGKPKVFSYPDGFFEDEEGLIHAEHYKRSGKRSVLDNSD